MGWHRELVHHGLHEQRGADSAAGYAVRLLAGARLCAELLPVPSVLRDAAGGVPRADCSNALRLRSPQSGAGASLGRAVRRGEMETAHGACELPQIDVYERQSARQSGGDVL